MNNTQSAHSFISLAAYGGPAIPLSILLMPLYIYLPPFYATEIGLDLTVIGTVFFFARLWDGLTDPLIGYLSDNTKTPWGKRRPWLVISTPLLMGATYFLLMPAQGIGPVYLFIWFALFYIAWTGLQIPYLSWGAELSTSYTERNKIAGFRETGTMIGMLFASGFPLFILGADDLPYRDVLEIFVISTLILLPITVTLASTLNRETTDVMAKPVSPVDLFNALKVNKPLLRYLGAIAFLICGLTIFDAVILLFLEHTVQRPGIYLELVFIQYLIAVMIAPATVMVANKISKHRTLCLGILLSSTTGLILWFAGSDSYLVLVIAFLLGGVGMSATRILPTSIVAEIVDYGLLRSKSEQTGVYMALYNLSYKLSSAFGVFIGLSLLDLGGFSAQGANDEPAQLTLKLVTCILPGIVTLGAILLLWNFPINAAKQRIIRRRIEQLQKRDCYSDPSNPRPQ